MKKNITSIFLLSLILLLNSEIYAHQENPSSFLKAYCGSDVLSRAFNNLGLSSDKADAAIAKLNTLADKNKGINSLYEIKLAAQAAGLHTQALKVDLPNLRRLIKKGEVIANITGNRHFCLIKDIHDETVSVYIPGLNYEEPIIPTSQFLEAWDNQTVLLINSQPIRLSKDEANFAKVSDDLLKKILGGQPCANVTGGGGSYSGTGGAGRYTSTNASGNEKDPTSKEPVVIRNGNLFLAVDDISIPTRSLPLELRRYYNSEIVSEVSGWLPEPGAGSWVIENGEYSAQGNRSTSDLKFKDFTLELDLQTIQPGPTYSWETAWVNFRYTEDPNDQRKAKDCYYFLMHTNGKIELAKWKNGTQYWLYSKSTSYRPTNKYRIKIIAQGSNIKVYLNGVLQINYTDSNPVLSEGRIALESYFSHAHFDNVKITQGTQVYNYDFNTDDNEFIFGYGWTHSYALKLKEYSNHVTLYRENNHKQLYVPQGGGTYSSVPVNYYTKLTKDSTGFSLKTKYGIHYRFDLSGRLQYIEDRNLNRTTLSYSSINGKTLLTAITEPTGRKITFTYGTNNMVAKATDPAGNYLEYSYDTAGHLIKVIDRNGNTTNYTYDSLTHNLKALTDPQGNNFNYTYTYNDRVNDQTDPRGEKTTFDYLWSTVHVINQKGELYKYNFDANEFLQSISDPENYMEHTLNDANGNILEYYGKNGFPTRFSYDSQGNKLELYDAQGGLTKFTYESKYNQPTSITDARGNVTTFSYDAKGNLVQTVNPEGGVSTNTYNSYGQFLTVTDPNGNIMRLTYDTYGNLSSQADAQGNTTTYTYDILGHLTKITDPLSNSQEYTYDKNGNLLSVKDALGNSTTYTYTKLDKLSSVTDPLGNSTSYAYDCFGNLLTVKDALGNTTTYTYDTTNQMHLNKANLLTITDAKGNQTTYEYDSLDRLTQTADAQGRFYQFSYDRQGNLISRTDAQNQTTRYEYDLLNQINHLTYPDSSYAHYSFDAVGNLTDLEDSGNSSTFTYDRNNRLTSHRYSDGKRLDYTYDQNGNRTSLEISGWGKIFYQYDSLNRLTKITTPDTKNTQFTYDQASRRTQLNYPNGSLTTYTYDKASRLTQLINKDKSAQDISKFIYTYDRVSRRTKIDLLNGSINYTYDQLNQLTQESGTVNSQNFTAKYTYDKVGNRLTSLEDGQTTNYTYNTLNQLTQSSAATQKLIQVKGTVSDVNPVTVKVNGISAIISSNQFTANNVPLNPGANILKAEATDSAGNIGAHQISVTYNSTATPAITYTYNQNANLAQRKVGTTTETFTYDYENRLKGYTSPTQTATYIPFAQGKRLAKTINSTTTNYYYDGDELILERTGASSIYYLHGPRIDEIIASVTRTPTTETTNCYHSDGLGSVVNLTDSQGAKVASYDYKAFGQIRNQSGSVSNPWLFTGRQFDAESGLYYNRNRYYSPTIGRFTTPDPSLTLTPSNIVMPYLLLNQLSNPLELQRYLYCVNNPVNYIDPNGEVALEALSVYLSNAVKRGVVSGIQAGAGTAIVSAISATSRGAQRGEILSATFIGFARGFTSGFIAGTLSGLGVPLPAARTFAGTVTGFMFGNPVGGLAGGLASGLSGLSNPFMASTVGSTVGEIFSPTEVGRGSEIK